MFRVIRSVLLCRGRWRDWLTAARTPMCQELAPPADSWNVVAVPLARARPYRPADRLASR